MSSIRNRITEPDHRAAPPSVRSRGTTSLEPGDVPELSPGPAGRDVISTRGASARMEAYAPQSAGAPPDPPAPTDAPPSVEAPKPNPALGSLPPDQHAKYDAIEKRLAANLASDDPELRAGAAQTRDDLDKLLTNGYFRWPDPQGQTLLDQIHSRLDQPLFQGDPPQAAPAGMREAVLSELVHSLARPEDISQGAGTTTCTTAVLQTLMARSDPDGYTRFALGLVFDGKGVTPTGREVVIDLQEVANRDDGSILDPVVQGSLIGFGLAGAAGQTAPAGGGRPGLAALAGGGRGGTGATGGGGRGGTGALGGGGRGGTGATGGGRWPVANAIDAGQQRFLSGDQLKNLIRDVMGQEARAIELGGKDINGNPTPATDRQIESIRNALAGLGDSPITKKGKWLDGEEPSWETVFVRGVPAAIQIEDPDGRAQFHAVMIVGIDHNRVTFVDPQKKDGGLDSDPRLQVMSIEEFKQRGEWAVLPPARPRSDNPSPPSSFARGTYLA